MKDWSEHRPKEFSYRGKWVDNWFSNMAPSPIQIYGITWPSVENFYQAMKDSSGDWERFAAMTPSESKREGRKVKIIPNWEQLKVDVMRRGLEEKFAIPEWKEKLLSTGNEVLVEWTNWNDRIWGADISDNRGDNLLGRLLMEIRDNLK